MPQTGLGGFAERMRKMPELIIVYWRDIPAQVIVKSSRTTAKRQLTDRFQEAIDMAAMRSGAHESDAYMAEWRRGEPEACGDDCEAEADAAQARLEAYYDDARLEMLITAGGHDNG